MNSGHGPGYRYDEPVGPKGGIFAFWVMVAIVYALACVFGL